MGLIVLEEIPPIGSNIYTVVEKMHTFPRLEGKEIYFTTFSFLRQLFLNQLQNAEFEHIFFNPLKEKLDNYNGRIKSEIGIKV